MFGSKKSPSVAENEAEGEVERVYHEIRQTLRVSGINLNFRMWAHSEKVLTLLWDAMRPTCETKAFEDAGDQIRGQSLRLAMSLGSVAAMGRPGLGESQQWQARRALLLYHYINPKLLVFTCALRRSLRGEAGEHAPIGSKDRIERGVPQGMYPMEMEDEEPDDARIEAVFADIKKTMQVKSINSDYRTLALWPDYLEHAWGELKPIVQAAEFEVKANDLKELARRVAAQLPGAPDLSASRLKEAGVDLEAVLETLDSVESLLPPLILNVALLVTEAVPQIESLGSPYPPRIIAPQAGRA